MPTIPKSIWPLVKRTLARFGVTAYRTQDHHHYVPDYYGRSAPKRSDLRTLPVFGELATSARAAGRTLLHYDRLYILFQALENIRRVFPATSPINLAEVGVFRGGTSWFLASAARRLGLDKAHLHSFDTFEGHAAQDIDEKIEVRHRTGDFADTDYEAVQAYLADLPGVTVFKGRFQDRCGEVTDKPFHLVHLDVDLYDVIAFGLRFFATRLAPGGLIVVDDYDVSTCPGVKQAIDEFLAGRDDFFSLHPMTEQCVLVKLSDKGPANG